MLVSMCFKIMSKVVKYTCSLRRYNYTHDQLNTRHFIIYLFIYTTFIKRSIHKQICSNALMLSFFRNFLRGGGAKFKFAPGRQIPWLRHCGDVVYRLKFSLIKILPEPRFELRSTAGVFSVLTARIHMLYTGTE